MAKGKKKKKSKKKKRSLDENTDGVEIAVEFSSDVLPLNDHAEALLEVMKKSGEPLSCRQLLKQTGIPSSEWGNAFGRLMMHDLVETSYCNKRGEVYSCTANSAKVISIDKPLENTLS